MPRIFIFMFTASVLLLTACGGGGGGGTETPEPIAPDPTDPNLIQGQALVTWRVPEYRENGEVLLLQEIGGFEIRYREQSESDYTYILYNGINTTSHTFENLNGIYQFQIAAFDANGLYSEFIELAALY